MKNDATSSSARIDLLIASWLQVPAKAPVKISTERQFFLKAVAPVVELHKKLKGSGNNVDGALSYYFGISAPGTLADSLSGIPARCKNGDMVSDTRRLSRLGVHAANYESAAELDSYKDYLINLINNYLPHYQSEEKMIANLNVFVPQESQGKQTKEAMQKTGYLASAAKAIALGLDLDMKSSGGRQHRRHR